MTVDLTEPWEPPKPRKTPVYAETILQTVGVVPFAKGAINLPPDQYQFQAFESAKSGDRVRMRDARKGVRKSTLDTLLQASGLPEIWCELQARGGKPRPDQIAMIEKLRNMGRFADWADCVDSVRIFWKSCGVPMHANAKYQAMVLDGKVDALVAKRRAEAEANPRTPRKSTPEANIKAAHRLRKQGILT